MYKNTLINNDRCMQNKLKAHSYIKQYYLSNTILSQMYNFTFVIVISLMVPLNHIKER